MRKGFRFIAVCCLLAGLFAFATAASATMRGTEVMISAGSTLCTDEVLVSTSYSSYGEANQFVKWSIWYGSTPPPSIREYVLADASSFPEQTFNFAGWFQTCVKNTSGAEATIFIEEFYQ
jgi:hypothetical protein